MSLTNPVLWWLVCGVLVAAELATGTFYLLMLAFGCAAGAVAAHAGAGTSMQFVTAAVVGMAATALWHYKRARAPRSAPAESNRDVHLDVGERVSVGAWADNGQAQVNYRGSNWVATHGGEGVPQAGEHVIVAVHGNRLVLRRAQAAPL